MSMARMAHRRNVVIRRSSLDACSRMFAILLTTVADNPEHFKWLRGAKDARAPKKYVPELRRPSCS